MASLFGYMKLVQRLIRDTNQELVNPNDLIEYIAKPPTSGAVDVVTVTAGGSGYTSPTVTISAPDEPSGGFLTPAGAQALATANLFNGAISNIDVVYGGDGYFQPQVTITDPTGTGATAVATTSPILTLNSYQESYNFSNIPLQNYPGYGPVYAVRNVSLIYANYRYSLPQYAWSVYQAMIRQYPNQYYYVPTMCSQFGQGAAGSLYFYPLPSQTYQLELECYCWPQDLLTDQDVEAIPDPWTQAVVWLAAHYCYLELQNLNAAEYYRKLCDSAMPRYRSAASPGRVTNPYGRY